MSLVCREYGWTKDYVLYELTWQEFWLFYEHAIAMIEGKDVYQEPQPLNMAGVKVEKGKRVYNR